MACSDAVAVPGRPKPPWRERKERYLDHLEHEADADALLVSACDKVHNAGSILADLRTDGDLVWQRFTVQDPHEQALVLHQRHGDPPAQAPGHPDRRACRHRRGNRPVRRVAAP